ncbi:MAG: hypothetical protein Q4E36_04915 [Bacillota bacterium]|nr:hypothetical protein [Bacillota bacterium]
MKKKTLRSIILLLVLTSLILVGCNNTANQEQEKDQGPMLNLVQEEKGQENKVAEERVSNELTSEEVQAPKREFAQVENLPLVEGAVLGSASKYVEDRQLWDNFDYKEHKATAQKDLYGFHLPRILLDSPDAKKANKEIEELGAYLINLYKENLEYLTDDNLGMNASFSVYEDRDILSVHVVAYNIWEGYETKSKIYNFSLADGNFISDEKVLSYFGLEKDQVLAVIEDSIVRDYEILGRGYDMNVEDYSFIYNMENILGLALDTFWDSFGKKNHVYIDELGNPMVAYFKLAPSHSGDYEGPAKLVGKALNPSPYLDEYVKMARALGVDPADKNNKGFMIFLGYANYEEDLQKVLERLYPWQEAFMSYKDPSMLVTVTENYDSDAPDLIGQEYYLFVPKYKNSSLRLKQLELGDNGNLKEVENYILDSNSVTGPTLICQNFSEIAPNAKLVVRHRDDVFEFSPTISLKDGSVELPDEIMDGEKVLDWDRLIVQENYSYLMFERLVSLLGRG